MTSGVNDSRQPFDTKKFKMVADYKNSMIIVEIDILYKNKNY